MLSPCKLSPEADAALRRRLEMEGAAAVVSVELEFREVPYFVVSRSQERWQPDQGDINEIHILAVTELGLVVDPDARPLGRNPNQAVRHTLIPWGNIISLSISRTGDDAGGTRAV